MDVAVKAETGAEIRKLARTGTFNSQTAGQAPDYLQGNVVILPLRYAGDFLQYCLNNPKPCPLIGLSDPGDPFIPSLGADLDIRSDIPSYRIYRQGRLAGQANDISDLWADDHVTFVLGCSFTFEEALMRAGFGVRHIEQGRNASMFKTNIQTIPGGIFEGPLVVTMRPFRASEIAEVYDICAQYPHAHGAPVYWGDPEAIGIIDLQSPDYGDALDMRDDEIPVFWACGVTPQAAIEAAKPDLCVTHTPGYMLVTDVPSRKPPETITGMASFQHHAITTKN